LSAELRRVNHDFDSTRYSAPKSFISRHRIALAGAATTVMLLLLALVYLLRQQPAGSGRGLAATRLTVSGNADRPAISPDGKLVVYVQHGQGDSLWLRQTNQSRTANDVQIIPAELGVQIFGVTVTPDGTNVDYLRGASIDILELWRAPILGGARKRLIDKVNTPVGWSPDGKQMAFIRWDVENATTSLVIADDEGMNEREVAVRQAPAAFPAFFSRNGQGMQRPAWSTDGASIAVVGTERPGDRQVVIVDVAQSHQRVLRVGDGSLRSLGWLDAKTLLLTRATKDSTQLWRMSYPEGSLSRASFDDLTPITGGFSVTSDRDQFVTTVRIPKVGLWVGDGKATNGKQYMAPKLGLDVGSPGGFSLTWVGHKLVYPIRGDRPTIVAVDPERESVEELVPSASSPASSPDGRTIVYVAKGDGANAGLWKADPDGRHPVRLVSGNVDLPVVTPDRRVIFGSNRSKRYSLWVVPLAGGAVQELVGGPATSPSISPDGLRLMYSVVDDQHPKGVLVACDLPACSRSEYLSPELPAEATLVTWAPDGRGFAYVKQSNIWVQPNDRGTPYSVTNFTDGSIGHYAWSHDGTRLAISRSLGTSTDVILFKKF